MDHLPKYNTYNIYATTAVLHGTTYTVHIGLMRSCTHLYTYKLIMYLYRPRLQDYKRARNQSKRTCPAKRYKLNVQLYGCGTHPSVSVRVHRVIVAGGGRFERARTVSQMTNDHPSSAAVPGQSFDDLGKVKK